MGAAALAYSIFTDYELGAIKLIPMPVHLRIDWMWTACLAAGPWLLGFGRRGARYWLPYAAVSFAAAAVIATSKAEKTT
jgi:hypothetical protein